MLPDKVTAKPVSYTHLDVYKRQLLHSATMVKAGVYLLIRIAPALNGTAVGMLVALIGGYTFISASMMAIAQNDGKKVLALSTISNL